MKHRFLKHLMLFICLSLFSGAPIKTFLTFVEISSQQNMVSAVGMNCSCEAKDFAVKFHGIHFSKQILSGGKG